MPGGLPFAAKYSRRQPSRRTATLPGNTTLHVPMFEVTVSPFLVHVLAVRQGRLKMHRLSAVAAELSRNQLLITATNLDRLPLASYVPLAAMQCLARVLEEALAVPHVTKTCGNSCQITPTPTSLPVRQVMIRRVGNPVSPSPRGDPPESHRLAVGFAVADRSAAYRWAYSGQTIGSLRATGQSSANRQEKT